MGKVRETWDIDGKFTNKQNRSFIILDYINAHKVMIKFESGCVKTVAKKEIVRGEVKDDLMPSVCGIGFMGCGDYNSKSPAYKVWQSMIKRCYSSKDKEQPYAGVVVCKDWHDFQHFAEWYNSYPYDREPGWELDKDLILKGNKEYGPSVCSFLPTEVNSCVIKLGGVYFHNKSGKYIAQCRTSKASRYIGLYLTEYAAMEAYNEEKHLRLTELCEKYQGKIHPRVLENLRSWVYG